MKITESEILEALRVAMQKAPSGDGFTIRELRISMGNGNGMAGEVPIREALRTLLSTGRAESVRVSRLAMDRSMRNVSGYRLVGKKK